MAHFAEIGPDNIVIRVLVVPDEQEHRGQEFMADDLGLGGTWIQCSYNTHGGVHRDSDGEPDGGTAVRANFAGAGYTYDPDEDVFYEPEPLEGDWVLNTGTWLWEETE